MKFKALNVLIILIIFAIINLGCGNSRRIADDKKLDEQVIKNMIDSFKFSFVAEYVSPMGSVKRALSSGYQISVSKDSIISTLPFFGRGYVVPISPADVDFDFTSTKFTHTTTAANRGWNISIKPQDQHYLLHLYFRVFDNGSASLNITSINRSAVSYSGYIMERKSDTKAR